MLVADSQIGYTNVILTELHPCVSAGRRCVC